MNARGAVIGRVVRRSVVRRSAAAVLGIATVLGATGSGGVSKRAISGCVTLEGKPLDEAVIMFVPLDIPAGKTGCADKQGRHERSRDRGLLPGLYRVEIADEPPIDHTASGKPPRSLFRGLPPDHRNRAEQPDGIRLSLDCKNPWNTLSEEKR